MLISFLISQQNHIARIRRCIGNICQRYGEAVCAENELPPGEKLYGIFPLRMLWSRLQRRNCGTCNLGIPGQICEPGGQSGGGGKLFAGEDKGLCPIRRRRQPCLNCTEWEREVADCICLFGLHHLEAFPVDTHIRQALEAPLPERVSQTEGTGELRACCSSTSFSMN